MNLNLHYPTYFMVAYLKMMNVFLNLHYPAYLTVAYLNYQLFSLIKVMTAYLSIMDHQGVTGHIPMNGKGYSHTTFSGFSPSLLLSHSHHLSVLSSCFSQFLPPCDDVICECLLRGIVAILGDPNLTLIP